MIRRLTHSINSIHDCKKSVKSVNSTERLIKCKDHGFSPSIKPSGNIVNSMEIRILSHKQNRNAQNDCCFVCQLGKKEKYFPRMQQKKKEHHAQSNVVPATFVSNAASAHT